MNRLLAQHQLPDGVSAIRDRFQRGTPISTILLDVLILLMFLAIPYVILLCVRRYSRRSNKVKPRSLFNQALRQLPLSGPERKLLKTLARDRRLANPAILLLSPSILTSQARAWTQSAPDDRALRIADVCQKLFPGIDGPIKENPLSG